MYPYHPDQIAQFSRERIEKGRTDAQRERLLRAAREKEPQPARAHPLLGRLGQALVRLGSRLQEAS
jgi:hypothetical protein